MASAGSTVDVPLLGAPYVVANPLETFLHSYLSDVYRSNSTYYHTVRNPTNNTYADEALSPADSLLCSTDADCRGYFCTVLTYTAIPLICVKDQCLCPTSYYHIAVDPGVLHAVFDVLVFPMCSVDCRTVV